MLPLVPPARCRPGAKRRRRLMGIAARGARPPLGRRWPRPGDDPSPLATRWQAEGVPQRPPSAGADRRRAKNQPGLARLPPLARLVPDHRRTRRRWCCHRRDGSRRHQRHPTPVRRRLARGRRAQRDRAAPARRCGDRAIVAGCIGQLSRNIRRRTSPGEPRSRGGAEARRWRRFQAMGAILAAGKGGATRRCSEQGWPGQVVSPART